MTKLIALTALLILSFGSYLFGFVYGWGLSVHSWMALVTSWFLSIFLSVAVTLVKDSD